MISVLLEPDVVYGDYYDVSLCMFLQVVQIGSSVEATMLEGIVAQGFSICKLLSVLLNSWEEK